MTRKALTEVPTDKRIWEVNVKALVKYEKGIGMMEIREVPIPEPSHGEALIKVAYCGICGTDIKRRSFRYFDQ